MEVLLLLCCVVLCPCDMVLSIMAELADRNTKKANNLNFYLLDQLEISKNVARL